MKPKGYFQKLPVTIYAERFDPDTHPWPEGVYQAASLFEHQPHYYIDTLEGEMEVTPGDYVITGIFGERYPCKPDIFELTYEEFNDDHGYPIMPDDINFFSSAPSPNGN